MKAMKKPYYSIADKGLALLCHYFPTMDPNRIESDPKGPMFRLWKDDDAPVVYFNGRTSPEKRKRILNAIERLDFVSGVGIGRHPYVFMDLPKCNKEFLFLIRTCPRFRSKINLIPLHRQSWDELGRWTTPQAALILVERVLRDRDLGGVLVRTDRDAKGNKKEIGLVDHIRAVLKKTGTPCPQTK